MLAWLEAAGNGSMHLSELLRTKETWTNFTSCKWSTLQHMHPNSKLKKLNSERRKQTKPWYKICLSQPTTRLSGFPIREDYSLIQLKPDLQSIHYPVLQYCWVFLVIVASSGGNTFECHNIVCTLYSVQCTSLASKVCENFQSEQIISWSYYSY